MKRIVFVAFMLALALSLIACSVSPKIVDSPVPTNPPEPLIKIEDVSIDNWQAVVLDYFGIELSAPNGWTVREVQSLNGKSDVLIEFVIADESTDWAAFGETVFDKTMAASTAGIKGVTGDTAYTTFEEVRHEAHLASWKYFYPSTSGSYAGIAPVFINYGILHDGAATLVVDGLMK